MSVSKNRGTPKWMVYNGKPYALMDDFGGKLTHYFWKHPHGFATFSIFSLLVEESPFKVMHILVGVVELFCQ